MKTVRKVIDGQTYEFFYLSPKVGMRVLTRLAKLIGQPLAAVADGVLKSTGGGKLSLESLLALNTSNLPPDMFGKAVTLLVERLDETEVVDTIETLLERVHVQGDGDKGTRPIRLELDFQGRIGALLKVVRHAIEVNFGDFFGESSALAGAMAAIRTTSE